MATTQREREAFLYAMAAEGVPLDVARLVMRHAGTIQRCEEAVCSSEAADRDRVPCPGAKDAELCCCDFGYSEDGKHEDVPRVERTIQFRRRSIRAALEPYGIEPVFSGDPRGACVKLKVPSGKTDDWGRTGVCVPA